jgi:hypothetical protein
MNKMLSAVFLTAVLLMFCVTIAYAGEETQDIPDWSCREVSELGKKYDATRKLPDAVIAEGKPCPKSEVTGCLLSVIDRVLEKCDREGEEAVPREDLDRIARLHEALKPELAGTEGYQARREAIERILAKPEEPAFALKAGIKGFARGEGGGNFRLPDLAYSPGHAEGRFLYRVQPYVYWHPVDYLDIHLEGQGYGYTGGSQYLGKYSLYQGYVEGRLPNSDGLSLKVGRQEFVYGSAFILGNDTFFKGLSFDAARLRIKPVEPLAIDFLGGWYATPFSDGVEGNLVGGYASYALGEGNVIEAYGFNDIGSAEHYPGEYLNTWGLRGTVAFGPVSLEIEPVFQSGRTFNGDTGNNDRINAWGGHADVTVEAEVLGRKNSCFASYAYGSGDRDAVSGISSRREFRNPNTDTSLTGDMSLVGDLSGVDAGESHASGLQIFNLGWGIELTKELNFSAAARYFYANAVADGFSKDLGLETDFTLAYTVNEAVSLLVGYDRFFTGKFFRDATGNNNDVDYGYVMLQFDLSKTWQRVRKG